MFKRLLIAAFLGVLFCQSATGQSALTAKEVSVFETSDVTVTFGRVAMMDRTLPSVATLVESDASPPRMTFLGCRFDVVLEPDNATLQRASPVFSKKLTTPNSDPPPAGFGHLTNPTPLGVTDPVTSVGCNGKLHYFVFFYRQKPTFGLVEIETIVLEYDEAGRAIFEAETFDPEAGRPSAQTANVVTAARGLYRISLRAPEEVLVAEKQRSEVQNAMLGLVARLALSQFGVLVP